MATLAANSEAPERAGRAGRTTDRCFRRVDRRLPGPPVSRTSACDTFWDSRRLCAVFYGLLEKSPIRLIGCTRKDSAGFAADAYARLNGIGAVCVTYCVGGLSVCNSIAGAYAEKSPVVVISGSPGVSERLDDPLLHHRVKDFRTPGRGVPPDLLRRRRIGRSADRACGEIDRVLATVVSTIRN